MLASRSRALKEKLPRSNRARTRVRCPCLKSAGIIIFLIVALAPTLTAQYPINPKTIPEYAPVEAVWIEWTFDPSTWNIYSALINEIQEVAKAYLLVPDSLHEVYMRGLLFDDSIPLQNIVFFQTPTERMWIRDHGPITITDANKLAFLDFDDFANSGIDENLPTRLAQILGINSYDIDLVFDGGNIMVDNYNNLFCTKRLYTRNPTLTPDSINAILNTFMGIEHVHTFCALANDYWGHIDMQMKLLDDTTVVISYYAPSHPSHDSTESNYQHMQALTNPYGGNYRIEWLPTSGSLKNYANSLIVNDKIIMPSYGISGDSVALEVYQSLKPDHDVVAIDCNTIIAWEGAIHCITMQHPYYSGSIGEDRREPIQTPLLSPNPSRNILRIRGDGFSGRVRIINTLGAVVLETALHNTTAVNVESLGAGVYFLVMDTANECAQVHRFVKIK